MLTASWRGPSPRLLVIGASLSTSTAMGFVVSIDGAAATSALTSKEFLLSQPPGAYTTARTCARGTRLFEWDTHVARTAASAEAMLADPTHSPPGELRVALLEQLAKPERLGKRLEATVRPAVRRYIDEHGDDTELKVTVLVSWQACDASAGALGSVACHVAPLPPLPSAPVKVEVRGAPRANAAAKDSSWVAERAPLEALMNADVNELLLATSDGELLEGSQTNFYAIVGGAVHTAGDGVLAGTVRRLLLEVCEREGVPVVLKAPLLSDIASWDGALISSTSRLLLPVDELYVPAEGQRSSPGDLRRAFGNAPDSLAARLKDLVRGEVEAHSTQIV